MTEDLHALAARVAALADGNRASIDDVAAARATLLDRLAAALRPALPALISHGEPAVKVYGAWELGADAQWVVVDGDARRSPGHAALGRRRFDAVALTLAAASLLRRNQGGLLRAAGELERELRTLRAIGELLELGCDCEG